MEILAQSDRLSQDGWYSRTYTLTGIQAYLWGTLIALPFAAVAGGLYRVFLLGRAVRQEHTGLILLAVILVSLSVHELVHSLGWSLAGRLGRNDIKFLFQHGMPRCSCWAVLSAKDYLTGVLLPFLVLGGGGIVFLIVYPGTISVLTALVNLLFPGDDLLIAWKILRSGAVRIAGHPNHAGFVGFFPLKTDRR